MKRKHIYMLALAMICISIWFSTTLFWKKSGNYSLTKFVPVNSQAYREYLNNYYMDDVDIKIIQSSLVTAHMAYLKGRLLELELPNNITYYHMVDGKLTEAFTIRKGTTVDVDVYKGMPPGQGFLSFPTHQKGLRYVRPFTIIGEEPNEEYYYVYLNDLETVYLKYYYSDKARENGWSSQTLSKSMITFTRYIDTLLYDRGVFCSFD